MKLLTWNIQWGLGCDGNVDLAENRRHGERPLCDADVFCFQEVSRGFPDYDSGEDQPAVSRACFRLHGIFRPAVDITSSDGRAAGFRQYDSLTRSRLRVTSHMLPWPAIEARTMQRQGLEAVVADLVRAGERHHLSSRISFGSASRSASEGAPAICTKIGPSAGVSLFATDHRSLRTIAPAVAAIVCGDFNFEPQDALYTEMQRAFVDEVCLCRPVGRRHPGKNHAPTAGIADVAQWPGGAHCRDFIFATENLRIGMLDVRCRYGNDSVRSSTGRRRLSRYLARYEFSLIANTIRLRIRIPLRQTY